MISRFPLILLLASIALAAPSLADPPEVQVYKSPTCGCCNEWISHLRDNGFTVSSTDVPDVMPIKHENGVPHHLGACHTALVGGYVVEGHVPAEAVRELLRERPPVAGLTVPGMPIGSPGMEGPNPERYKVFSFGAGGVKVFSEHQGNATPPPKKPGS